MGSIGWYTAFAMQNASYVRAVGQIEVVFTLLIAWFYFRERMTALELLGVGVDGRRHLDVPFGRLGGEGRRPRG